MERRDARVFRRGGLNLANVIVWYSAFFVLEQQTVAFVLSGVWSGSARQRVVFAPERPGS